VPLAKRFYKLIGSVTLIIISIMSIATFIARNQIAEFFTEDETVVHQTSMLLIVGAVVFLFDGVQQYLQGMIRALGLQDIASYIALSLFWGLGIPLAALCAFYFEWDVLGLNCGLSVATIIQFFAYYYIVQRKDWQKISEEAIKRMK